MQTEREKFKEDLNKNYKSQITNYKQAPNSNNQNSKQKVSNLEFVILNLFGIWCL